MNYLSDNFTNVEEGMAALRDAVKIRNQMGGALYWNILNDDATEISRKVKALIQKEKTTDEAIQLYNEIAGLLAY